MLALQLALFVFFTMGIKVVLGLLACWLLLPTEPGCPACPGDTVAVEPARGAAWLARLTRVQRRWCLRCGRPFWARGMPGPWRLAVGVADRGEAERVRHRA